MKTFEPTTGIRHDRFADIQYQTSRHKGNVSIGLRLGRPWVFDWIVRLSWGRYSEAILSADWGSKQCARSLFGDVERWNKLSFGVRQAIGRCLRYFVSQGMLPLQVVNPKATGTKFYALIGD